MLLYNYMHATLYVASYTMAIAIILFSLSTLPVIGTGGHAQKAMTVRLYMHTDACILHVHTYM